jgi:hypothetical protein
MRVVRRLIIAILSTMLLLVAVAGAGPRASAVNAKWKIRGCPPLHATTNTMREFLRPPRSRLLVTSGVRLFAIVDPVCLHRYGYGHAAILVEYQHTRAWKLLAPIPTGALSLAAAGDRLAITYVSDVTNIAVYDSRTGRHLFRVTATPDSRRLAPPSTAVDDLGDLLVTETGSRPPPSTRASLGWWASPGRPVAHELALLTTDSAFSDAKPSGKPSAPTVAAALSHGRIAYATGGRYVGERIQVLNLHTGRTRTAVRLQGETGLLGLDLTGDKLTWTQQNTVPVGTHQLIGGGELTTCNVVPLGDAKLMTVRLRSLPASGVTVGKPLPAADQPPCTALER